MKIIYEDKDLLVVDKPAGLETTEMIEILSKEKPGLEKIHRLDKDTSGVNLIAKSPEALIFFQKQFKNREIEKKYTALVAGNIKDDSGRIETLIGRAPKEKKKQKAYLPFGPKSEGKRDAITDYRVLERYGSYTLLEVSPKTGRKHQIRCHMVYLGHPIIGDKMYGFKGQSCPKGLNRQFLHASSIKVRMPDNNYKEFKSDLAEDLKEVIENL